MAARLTNNTVAEEPALAGVSKDEATVSRLQLTYAFIMSISVKPEIDPGLMVRDAHKNALLTTMRGALGYGLPA